jgi:uncharacterized membrane protein (DUF106 family)
VTVAAPAATPARTAKSSASSSTFLLFAGMLLVLFLMFNPSLRVQTGVYLGYVLNPVLKPLPVIIQLLVVGSFMVLLNTTIRHFFTDWVKTARVQAVMRQYQKEFNEARKSNNTFKIKRLTEMNPEIMKEQADLSSQQMKPMILTMLLVLPVLAWLYTVITPASSPTCATYLSVPWQTQAWCATRGLDVPILGFIPRWVAVYSLLSIPVGQVAQRALKLWEFRHVAIEGDAAVPEKVT